MADDDKRYEKEKMKTNCKAIRETGNGNSGGVLNVTRALSTPALTLAACMLLAEPTAAAAGPIASDDVRFSLEMRPSRVVVG